MAESILRDRTGLIMYGPLSARPAADSFRGPAVFIATDDDGNPYKVFIKPGDGQDWLRVLGSHTHIFSDLVGYLAAGYWNITTAPYSRIPSGNAVLWKHHVPAGISISGTVLEIDRLDVHITGRAPTGGPVSFTLKRNGQGLVTVSLYSGQTYMGESFTPVQIVPGTDVLELVGPSNAWGALGLDAKIRVRRRTLT